jgi:hypothetical protein
MTVSRLTDSFLYDNGYMDPFYADDSCMKETNY